MSAQVEAATAPADGGAGAGGKLVAVKRRKVEPAAKSPAPLTRAPTGLASEVEEVAPSAPVRAGVELSPEEERIMRDEEAKRARMAAEEVARIKATRPRGFGKFRVYWATVLVLKWPLRWLFRIRRSGAYKSIPKRGPLLLVSNHVSAYDPIIFGATVARPITFLAKSYVFRTRFTHWFFHDLFGQIKVDRQAHGNEAAVVSALRALKNGQAICIYPEGARTRTGHLCRARSGVARIALATGEPVWPVVTKGMYEMAPRGTSFAKFWKGVEVIVGPPLSFPNLLGKENDKKIVRAVADQIMLEMAKLIGPEEVEHYRQVIRDEQAPLLAID